MTTSVSFRGSITLKWTRINEGISSPKILSDWEIPVDIESVTENPPQLLVATSSDVKERSVSRHSRYFRRVSLKIFSFCIDEAGKDYHFNWTGRGGNVSASTYSA